MKVNILADFRFTSYGVPYKYKLFRKLMSASIELEDTNHPDLPPPPEKPDPRSCCNRGCERCIFVYYEEALAKWHEKVAEIEAGSI